MARRRLLAAAVALITVGGGAAIAPPAVSVPASGRTTAVAADPDVGTDSAAPHAAANRVPARTRVVTRGAATVSDVDFGNLTFGRYRTAVRGVLVTPTKKRRGGARLVADSHLRTAGCTGHVYGYPCPRGTSELRMDRGMTYLGEALAARGYAVLIPDVSGAWMGSGLTEPYDQRATWTQIVSRMRTRLADDVTRGSRNYGRSLRGAVDMRTAGLLVHSRSGYAVSAAQKAFAPTRLASVLAYGPAYDTPDLRGRFSPMVPDVPYLALVGHADEDVPYAADLWLTERIGTSRSAPALVATVPGLGHNYINRTLSSRRLDDRLECDKGCPGATAHERFLGSAAGQ